MNWILFRQRNLAFEAVAISLAGSNLQWVLVKNGKHQEADEHIRGRIRSTVNFIVSEEVKERDCYGVVHRIRNSKYFDQIGFHRTEIRAIDQYLYEFDERSTFQAIKNLF